MEESAFFCLSARETQKTGDKKRRREGYEKGARGNQVPFPEGEEKLERQSQKGHGCIGKGD